MRLLPIRLIFRHLISFRFVLPLSFHNCFTFRTDSFHFRRHCLFLCDFPTELAFQHDFNSHVKTAWRLLHESQQSARPGQGEFFNNTIPRPALPPALRRLTSLVPRQSLHPFWLPTTLPFFAILLPLLDLPPQRDNQYIHPPNPSSTLTLRPSHASSTTNPALPASLTPRPHNLQPEPPRVHRRAAAVHHVPHAHEPLLRHLLSLATDRLPRNPAAHPRQLLLGDLRRVLRLARPALDILDHDPAPLSPDRTPRHPPQIARTLVPHSADRGFHRNGLIWLRARRAWTVAVWVGRDVGSFWHAVLVP